MFNVTNINYFIEKDLRIYTKALWISIFTSFPFLKNCHNEIYYGKHADKIVEKPYLERKEKLEAAGIFIALEELLNKYHCISKKRIIVCSIENK